MYITKQPVPLTDEQEQWLTGGLALTLPPGYAAFLRRFGEGTYRGWMNVQLPDTEVLQPFSQYDLWNHDENSPIAQEEIAACIAIGTTVDGDFLAVHPQSSQLLWLPRHGDELFSLDLSLLPDDAANGETYISVLESIYLQVYGSKNEGAVYYEPWTASQQHMFLRLPPDQAALSLPELAGKCRDSFPPDFTQETAYTCMLFYQRMGGYIRFNYANGQEVVLIYAQGSQFMPELHRWCLDQGCTPYPQQ